MTKSKKSMLIALVLTLAMAFVGALTVAYASEASAETKFVDALNNGRVTQTVNEDGSVGLTLKTDSDYSLTRAYFVENVSAKSFSMKFIVNDFNEDGAMRISLMSSKEDFPMSPYGDGFGVYFWDETAWGHAVYSSLRADFATYRKDGTSFGNDAKVLIRDGEYKNREITLTIWDYDADNYAISVKMDYNGTQQEAIGTYPKSNLPQNFNVDNCVLMITPDIDSNRGHSYAGDIKITVKEINSQKPVAEYFNVTAVSGEHGSVTSSVNKVSKGGSVTFTVEPDSGYELDTATINGVEVTLSNGVYVAENVQGDVTFEATFKETEKETFEIKVIAGEHGKAVASRTSGVVFGDEITFTVTPDNFYNVDEAKLNGIPVNLVNNELAVTVNENQTFEVTFKKFAIDEDSHFAYGLYDTLKDRANVEIDENGNEIVTLGVKDGSPATTRLYSKTAISISSFDMTFTVNALSTDGGFRLSFLAGNDDYPMEGYGDGFAIYFWDETAWGHPAGTALRSDVYSYLRDPADKTSLNVWASREVPYIGLEIKVSVRINDAKDALKINVTIGEAGYEYDVMLNVLPATFNYNKCYMLLSPEIDSSREHSKEKDVVLTISALAYEKASEGQGGGDTPEPEPTEYSISYYFNGEIIRTAYADEGDVFNEYTPTLEGYKFIGWYLDESFERKYDFSTPATADIVVYAKTEKIKSEGSGLGCSSSVATAISVIPFICGFAVITMKKKAK